MYSRTSNDGKVRRSGGALLQVQKKSRAAPASQPQRNEGAMDTVENVSGTPVARKELRKIGTEKFVVRVFREKFVEAVIRGGLLREVLDDFLRIVLTSPDADPTDKKYARTTYQDAIVRIGGTGLPDWAREDAPRIEASRGLGPDRQVKANSDPPVRGPDRNAEEDATAVLSHPGYESSGTLPTASTLSDEDFLSMIEGADADDEFAQFVDPSDRNTLSAHDGPVWCIMRERFATRMTHPFLESFTHSGVRYVAVGSVFGVIPSGPMKGKEININFTVNPYRSIRDIPEEVLVRHDGRVVSVLFEDPMRPGLRKCLYVIRHTAGLKLRFWTRIDRHDAENGKRFVILTDDERGWKEVDRKHF